MQQKKEIIYLVNIEARTVEAIQWKNYFTAAFLDNCIEYPGTLHSQTNDSVQSWPWVKTMAF